MYFDTLKVSTLEQTAEQTSARGGLGNPELITWDYNKEISVSLEDALYTPASQSLMWGGKFGVGRTKIYGAWDPYVYEKDEYGRIVYLKKLVATASSYNEDGTPKDDAIWTYENGTLDTIPTEAEGWYEFVCPCDNKIKYMKLTPAAGAYKYASWLKDHGVSGYSLDEEGRFSGINYQYLDKAADDSYKDYEQTIPSTYYTEDYFKELMIDTEGNRTSFILPECAEFIMDSFLDFENVTRVIDENFMLKKELCPQAVGRKAKDCTDLTDAYIDYTWKQADVRMVSLEEDQDLHYTENLNIRFRMQEGMSQKMIMVRPQNGEYDGKYTFYTNLSWEFEDIAGKTVKHSVPIPVGTFYIIQDHNQETLAAQDFIFPIKHGIEDVDCFERMEKCMATQTFCIDADKNLTMYQYSTLPQYSQVPLTVFIDPTTMRPYEANSECFRRQNGSVVTGNLRIIKQYDVYYKWTRSIAPSYTSMARRITVDAIHFPGTYRLVGETYSRRRKDGKDERYQFEIPLCKISPETNLTLQADGDPTTFTMNMKVLRREDGVMMKLSQYQVEQAKFDGYCSGSTEVVPQDKLNYEQVFDKTPPEHEEKETSYIYRLHQAMLPNVVYCLDHDCQPPFNSEQAYLRLPNSIAEANLYVNGTDKYKDAHRDLLIIEVSTDEGLTWNYVLQSDIDNGTYHFTINVTGGGD